MGLALVIWATAYQNWKPSRVWRRPEGPGAPGPAQEQKQLAPPFHLQATALTVGVNWSRQAHFPILLLRNELPRCLSCRSPSFPVTCEERVPAVALGNCTGSLCWPPSSRVALEVLAATPSPALECQPLLVAAGVTEGRQVSEREGGRLRMLETGPRTPVDHRQAGCAGRLQQGGPRGQVGLGLCFLAQMCGRTQRSSTCASSVGRAAT